MLPGVPNLSAGLQAWLVWKFQVLIQSPKVLVGIVEILVRGITLDGTGTGEQHGRYWQRFWRCTASDEEGIRLT